MGGVLRWRSPLEGLGEGAGSSVALGTGLLGLGGVVAAFPGCKTPNSLAEGDRK